MGNIYTKFVGINNAESLLNKIQLEKDTSGETARNGAETLRPAISSS
ncbi:unnamed protein product, partial [Allacma fusca]